MMVTICKARMHYWREKTKTDGDKRKEKTNKQIFGVQFLFVLVL